MAPTPPNTEPSAAPATPRTSVAMQELLAAVGCARPLPPCGGGTGRGGRMPRAPTLSRPRERCPFRLRKRRERAAEGLRSGSGVRCSEPRPLLPYPHFSPPIAPDVPVDRLARDHGEIVRSK